MNKFLSFLSAAVIMLTLGACGGDDGPSDPGQGQNKVVNTNRNIPTSMTPKEITRLEFPKLASENSIVLVHHTSGAQDVSYSCEWDYKKKSNRWSCCAMTNKTIKGGAGRVGDFEEDPNLPTAMRFSDTNAMYTRSGYTRGHLIASADIQYSRKANHTTFYYSNIQPQHYDFNAGQNYEGIWRAGCARRPNRSRTVTPSSCAKAEPSTRKARLWSASRANSSCPSTSTWRCS